MFELEMFNLMNQVNQTETHNFLVFDCADLIDELNELIDNNLNVYSVCLIFYSIWLKEFQDDKRYYKWIKWIKFI